MDIFLLWRIYSLLFLAALTSSNEEINLKRNQWESYEAVLRRKLFHRTNYDPELRPVMKQSDKVTVKLGVSLHQIINVNVCAVAKEGTVFNRAVTTEVAYSDEKNQLMQVSLWIRQSWYNPFLTWNQSDYGGVNQINIKVNKVWIPDIYLYNNADADRDGALDRFKTKIVLSPNGRNMWLSPVLYSFSCKIDVKFFPFDEQFCSMKFGSWTFDGNRVDVALESQEGDTEKYVTNGEWNLIGLPAQRNEMIYVCCPEPYPDVTFTVHIRRRTQYYYINLIVPCALITSLTLMSFFLPPDSGERITLVITNLLTITMFMLIVAENMPATSEVVPLISIYYMGITFVVALSLAATCMVLKCFHNNPTITKIPTWMRVIVLNWLAKIVRIRVPPGLINIMEKHVKEEEELREEIENERRDSTLPPPTVTTRQGRRLSSTGSNPFPTFPPQRKFSIAGINHKVPERRCSVESRVASTLGLRQLFATHGSSKTSLNEGHSNSPASQTNVATSFETSMKELLLKQDSLLNNVRRLVRIFREAEENDIKKEEWKVVASVIDSCFFWVFTVALIISTLVIFLLAP